MFNIKCLFSHGIIILTIPNCILTAYFGNMRQLSNEIVMCLFDFHRVVILVPFEAWGVLGLVFVELVVLFVMFVMFVILLLLLVSISISLMLVVRVTIVILAIFICILVISVLVRIWVKGGVILIPILFVNWFNVVKT